MLVNYLNIIFNNFKVIIPFLLPFSILFSRTSADLIVISCSILFLLKSYFHKDWRWLKEPWIKYVFIFFAYILFVSSPQSIDIMDSSKYSLAFIRWPIFSVSLYYWLFTDQKSLKLLFWSFFSVLIFLIIDLWVQFFVGKDFFGFEPVLFGNEPAITTRLTGPLGNNVIPGRILLFYSFICITLSYYLNLFSSPNKFVFFSLITMFFGFITVFITGERMALLIFISAIIFFVAFIFILYSSLRAYIIYFIFLLIGIVVFFYLSSPAEFDRSILSTIKLIKNFSESSYGSVYQTAFCKWLNNPFFGGGYHQYRFIEPNIAPGLSSVASTFHAHNIPLNLLSETGIFGLILFYLIIFVIIRDNIFHFFFTKQWMSFILFSILIYICYFPFMSHFSFSHNWINSIMWTIIGLLFIFKFYKDPSHDSN